MAREKSGAPTQLPPTPSPSRPGAGDDGQPTPPSGSRSFWEKFKLSFKRFECRRYKKAIRGRIKAQYGDDAIFDEVMNSGDPELDGLQKAWHEAGCEDMRQYKQ
jgi:hypothetical protein